MALERTQRFRVGQLCHLSIPCLSCLRYLSPVTYKLRENIPVILCVCERDRERERGREKERDTGKNLGKKRDKNKSWKNT
jgi:hypothetical protein